MVIAESSLLRAHCIVALIGHAGHPLMRNGSFRLLFFLFPRSVLRMMYVRDCLGACRFQAGSMELVPDWCGRPPHANDECRRISS